MRFSQAWAETAKQNSTLKYCLLFSSLLCLVLAITTTSLALKPPLLIERACYSKTTNAEVNSQHTTQEVEAFLSEALKKRFDSDASAEIGWLAPSEEMARIQEQKEYAQKKIKQIVLVNAIQIQKNEATVEIDRVLSVERLRSVLPATVLVQISKVSRSATNPYGLMVEKVELKKEAKSDSPNN